VFIVAKGKSGLGRDFKRGENCSVLFRFLNWYEMFQAFRPKRNGIDNFGLNKELGREILS